MRDFAKNENSSGENEFRVQKKTHFCAFFKFEAINLQYQRRLSAAVILRINFFPVRLVIHECAVETVPVSSGEAIPVFPVRFLLRCRMNFDEFFPSERMTASKGIKKPLHDSVPLSQTATRVLTLEISSVIFFSWSSVSRLLLCLK